MMARKGLFALMFLSGLVCVSHADYLFSVNAIALDERNGVKVKEIRVDGVTADSVEKVSVPEGADVTVVFTHAGGYVWGNDTAVYANVTSNITVRSLPDSVRGYNGSTANPILISSVEDLLLLREMSNGGNTFKSKVFRQTVDLDLSECGPWTPIGQGTMFNGTYDGGGHCLDNVTLKNKLRGCIFLYVSNATIKDLTVRFRGFENPARGGCGGAIVGNATRDVKFIHVIAEGELTGVDNSSAGLAILANRGFMTGCTNRVNITGAAEFMGGLVAMSERDVSTERFVGMTYTDCANEGRIVNRSTIRGTGGIVGTVSDNHLATFVRCVNRGEIDAKLRGSLIGRYAVSANTVISAIDCFGPAEMPPIGVIDEGVRTITGLNFATVSSGVASFCSTPTGAGSFKVMLENADPIELSGVASGDRLILGDYEKYSGIVTCADPELSVKGVDGVWTVTAAMSVDVGTIEEGPEAGVFELHPVENQISAHIEGFSGTCLKIPGSLEFIRGVERSKLAVANAGYDVTAAVAFDGDAENGYALALDGSAVVNGVKVTPTIGEGVSDAFKVSDEPRIAIRSVPGLWYGLYRGKTPEEIDELCEVKQAESEMISLVDNLPRTNGSFYRVKVSLANPVKN